MPTLAVGLVGVVAAVVGAIADPRRVDAQRGGVAADEIFLFDPQHEEVRAVAVVWEQKSNDVRHTVKMDVQAWLTSSRPRRLIGCRALSVFIFSYIYFPFHSNMDANSSLVEDLLQPFSSEASAQSMTWLHQAEAATQLPSLQDDSDGPHVTSGGEGGISISKR